MLNEKEKEIDKLKSIVKVHKDFFEYEDTETINSEEIKALEHLLLEYEELKILEDDIKDKRIVYIDEPEFEENYIPKNKIMEKIEEIKNEYKNIVQTSDFIIADTIQPKIEILEELLEEND